MDKRKSTYESLRDWILQLPEVSEAPHRFGGTEFQVDGIEFMHSHGISYLDIRLSKADQAMVLKSGEALPHRFAPHGEIGWVSFRIETPEDLGRARKVIQLAYDNAMKGLQDIRARRVRSEPASA